MSESLAGKHGVTSCRLPPSLALGASVIQLRWLLHRPIGVATTVPIAGDISLIACGRGLFVVALLRQPMNLDALRHCSYQ
jgi:hypothetical protein